MLSRSAHRYLFLFFSALVAFSLPLSEVGISVGLIGLVANWALEWRYRNISSLKGAYPLFVFGGIYGLALVGLIFTTDFSWALHDLRIKLPLLLLPLVFYTSERLTERELHFVFLALVAGVLVGSMVSMLVLVGVIPVELTSSRSISIFISHIRFSLLVCMAVCCMVYMLFKRFRELSLLLKGVSLGVTVWLIMFVFILQSVTGMVVLTVLSVAFLIWQIRSIPNSMYRLWGFSFLVAAVLIVASFVTKTISLYYTVDKVDPSIGSYTTANGRLYSNNFTSRETENGHFVDLLVCEEELRREWNRRCLVQYDDQDANGFPLQYALKRFLTSKGLRKDSIGVWSLSNEEVIAVSKGVANVLDVSPFSIKGKIYRLVREIDHYRRGEGVGGASLAQRFVYWHVAKLIFAENWLTGVGTGDVRLAYKQKYAENPSLLPPNFQLRTHNQYITMFVTYGFMGGLFFIFALLYPIVFLKAWKEPLVLAFAAIFLLSMLNEDTLETHVGVSFAAFFYSLLVFGWARKLLCHGNAGERALG